MNNHKSMVRNKKMFEVSAKKKVQTWRCSVSIYCCHLGILLYGIVSLLVFMRFLSRESINSLDASFYHPLDQPKFRGIKKPSIYDSKFEFAIPICGQSDALFTFSERLGRSLSTLKSKVDVKLLVTKCMDDDDLFNEKYLELLEEKAGGISIDTVPLKVNKSDFTRGLAVNALAERACNVAGCYFSMVYVDLEIQPLFLENILKYVSTANKMYSPIIWSEYAVSSVRAAETIFGELGLHDQHRGQWRETSFGVYALKGQTVRSLTNSKNPWWSPWGGEGFELRDLADKSGFQMIRGHEPGLVHHWHPELCKSESVDYTFLVAERSFLGRCLDYQDTFAGSEFLKTIRAKKKEFFDHLVSLPVGPKRAYLDATTWVANAYNKFLKESVDFVPGRIPLVGDMVTYWYNHEIGFQLATVLNEEVRDDILHLQLHFLYDKTDQWIHYDPRRYDAQVTASYKNCTQSLHPSGPIGKDPSAEVSCRRVNYKAPQAAFEKAGKVIVGILSSSKNQIRRNTIRDTWKNKTSGIVFIVAGPWEDIEEEYLKYQDLLWIDDKEDFLMITYKTAMLVQVVNAMACDLGLNYTHLLKTDDDSYVALERLEAFLEEREYIDYWGRCGFYVPPIRDPNHKYYVSKEEYSEAHFPHYCQGGGMVMSQAMVQCAADQMTNTPFLSMEDVYMGMIAERCGIFPSQAHPDQIHLLRGDDGKLEDDLRPATMENGKIIQHHIKSDLDMTNHHDLIMGRSQSRKPLKVGLEFVHITKTGGSAVEKAAAERGINWGMCHYMEDAPEVGCLGSHDMDWWTSPHYQSYVLTSPWHTPPPALDRMKQITPYDGSDLFTVVRNPYSRAVSEYYCPWTGFNAVGSTRSKGTRNDPKVMNNWIRNMVEELERELILYKKESKQREGNQLYHEVQTDPNIIAQNDFIRDPKIVAQKHFINQAEYVFEEYQDVSKRRRIIPMENVVYYENMHEEFNDLMKRYGLDITLSPHSGVLKNKNKKLSHLDLDPETIRIINRYAAADFEAFGYEMVHSFDAGVEYSLNHKQ